MLIKDMDFRVLYHKEKKFYYSNENPTKVFSFSQSPKSDAEIEFFTNLCDKNGKKIYENDKVIYKNEEYKVTKTQFSLVFVSKDKAYNIHEILNKTPLISFQKELEVSETSCELYTDLLSKSKNELTF